MSKMNIPFSPPDISQLEIDEVVDTLQSGWITTGPKTKELERQLSDFTRTNKTVCLNSATAGLELILRVLGVGPGDEVLKSVCDPRDRILRRHGEVGGIDHEIGTSHGPSDALDKFLLPLSVLGRLGAQNLLLDRRE